MKTNQIRSKEKVKKFAEVFTAEREVKAMCDLAEPIISEIESNILEPSCGTGNFLVEIYKRKLNTILKEPRSIGEKAELGLKALESLYGIDIQPESVKTSQERLFKEYIDFFGATYQSIESFGVCQDYMVKAILVLKRNIVVGNALDFDYEKQWGFEYERE